MLPRPETDTPFFGLPTTDDISFAPLPVSQAGELSVMDSVSPILNAIACGTLLYVGLTEIVPEAFEQTKNWLQGLMKWTLFVSCGVGMMLLVTWIHQLSPHSHCHHGGGGHSHEKPPPPPGGGGGGGGGGGAAVPDDHDHAHGIEDNPPLMLMRAAAEGYENNYERIAKMVREALADPTIGATLAASSYFRDFQREPSGFALAVEQLGDEARRHHHDCHGHDHGHHHGHDHDHSHEHSHEHSDEQRNRPNGNQNDQNDDNGEVGHDHSHEHDHEHGHGHGSETTAARSGGAGPCAGGCCHGHAH